jgi:hypothetical protein
VISLSNTFSKIDGEVMRILVLVRQVLVVNVRPRTAYGMSPQHGGLVMSDCGQ